MLCKKFWWTPLDIANLSQDFYDDVILILNLENTQKRLEIEKMKNKSK